MGSGEASVALLDHFAEVEDARTRRSPHGLMELLLTAICAVLSGADNWAAVALWGRAKLEWLRQFLPFAHGIASHDTFGRVFALLNLISSVTRVAGRPKRETGVGPWYSGLLR